MRNYTEGRFLSYGTSPVQEKSWRSCASVLEFAMGYGIMKQGTLYKLIKGGTKQ